MNPLLRELLPRTIGFLLVMALAIFASALTLAYWQGWLYWMLFSACTVGAQIYFAHHDPALVRRRMHAGATAETEPAQKIIMAITSVLLVATYIVCGLDYQLRWSHVAPLTSLIAAAFVVIGYAIIVITLRANTFAASTIGVERDQRVISTGPYAVVRHPMYAGAAVTFLATPPALASLWGLVPAALVVMAMGARLIHEEQVLARELAGYDAYRARVRARLVPGVW
jgi:protein-S-isoprenylcysteine O-methyltransferase Ste14